jgi:hypothetical protein
MMRLFVLMLELFLPAHRPFRARLSHSTTLVR